MKRTIGIIAGILLAATMGGTAFAGNGHGNGPKNGGNPKSQAGGLPALSAKVATLQTTVNTIQGQVSALQGDITTLQGQVSTLQGQVGTLQGQVTDLQGQNNWAVVGSDGTVARNSGAPGSVTVTHTASTGIYEVVFSKDVSMCAYTATLGDTTTTVPAPVGFVSVSGDSGNVDGVIVQTYDTSAVATDASFHVYVSCP
jgi:TolA-binding protein